MKLRNILFGTPEERKRKKALKLKEKRAYQKAYAKGRIKRAEERGYQAGRGLPKKKGSLGKQLKNIFGDVEATMKGMEASARGFLDFGFSEPTRRKEEIAMAKAKTPLEEYILGAYAQRAKAKKAWRELEKHGTKLPSGGYVWTGKDLINYFEAQKKKRRKRKRR